MARSRAVTRRVAVCAAQVRVGMLGSVAQERSAGGGRDIGVDLGTLTPPEVGVATQWDKLAVGYWWQQGHAIVDRLRAAPRPSHNYPHHKSLFKCSFQLHF